MTDNLVIVESPTKAKTIGKMLGSKYKVVATIGHLRDLPKSKIGVDIENNFEPQYINVRGKATKINELKKLAKDSKNIFLATDPDREGEAISWHLAYLLGLDLNAKNRVEFSEITKENVKNSIKKPRTIDMDLVNAQQARRVLDRIVGYKLSPILWKKIKNGLSAGRVQSVALKLICDREEEINSFIPEEYWTIEAEHNKEKVNFNSSYYNQSDAKETKAAKIINEQEADKILNGIDKNHFEVVSIDKSSRKKKPFAPFTTSSLQQEANKKLGFSTSKTMSIAQQLYEGINLGKEGSVGLISYMRTDSTRISSVIIDEAKEFIIGKFGEKYHNGGFNYDKKKAGSQDAHEAVRPSSLKRSPESIKEYLTNEQYKLYDLIWKRTVASQMKEAQYETTSIKFKTGSAIFRTSGNIIKFDGFMALWPSDENDEMLPNLKVADVLKANKLDKIQHFTKPKARYSEASLVKALEEEGIGRPSTYASIIKSLLTRNYAVIEKKQFYPTEIGINVNSLLMKYFSDVINEEFTKDMEERLDKVSESKSDWRNLISNFYSGFEPLLDKAMQEQSDLKIKDEILDEKCPECGKNLVKKHGRNGDFIGCSGFPDCKFTKAIIKGTGVMCPKCGKEIIEKVTKRGKLFFGCSGYPDCDYASWNRPTGEKCPKCGDLLTRKKNRYGDFIVCNNENCDFEKTYNKE